MNNSWLRTLKVIDLTSFSLTSSKGTRKRKLGRTPQGCGLYFSYHTPFASYFLLCCMDSQPWRDIKFVLKSTRDFDPWVIPYMVIYPNELGYYWWRLVAIGILNKGIMISHKIKTMYPLRWFKEHVTMKFVVVVISMVLKIRPDQPIQPVWPSIDHYSSSANWVENRLNQRSDRRTKWTGV